VPKGVYFGYCGSGLDKDPPLKDLSSGGFLNFYLMGSFKVYTQSSTQKDAIASSFS
jgi:hypothetical protein